MLDLVPVIGRFCAGLLSFRIPGTGFSFLGFAVFLYTLHLIGKLLHSIFSDEGGNPGGGILG